MTPAARIQAAIELSQLIDSTPRPADALVSSYFRARRYIGSKDRGAVAELTYDILRHHARLNWWLERCGAATIYPRLRVLAYLHLVEEKPLKAIGELCDGAKFAPYALEESERAVLRQLTGHAGKHPEMPDHISGECPEWAAEPLRQRFGKSFGRELASLLKPAPLDLRVNPLRTNREAALAQLKASELKAEICKFSLFGIRVAERPALNKIAMLKDGAIEIQDEGSQLVALLVEAKAGQRVVDFCAGAGGKTLAIAAQMENKGRITACDVLANRLKRSAERFRRAGVHNIETRPLTSEHDAWVKHHKNTFDRVLVDAPCSGTGTWRRNPDGRWRSLGPGIETLLPLQASILESAARLVKGSGRLVYATCSLLPDENERQIEKFLAAHSDFFLVPYAEVWHRLFGAEHKAPCSGDYLSLTPAQHDTDGFFAAIMERKPTKTAEKTTPLTED